MIYDRLQPAVILVKATAAINIAANLLGAALSFVFFCVLEPRLNSSLCLDLGFADRAAVFIAVFAFAMSIVGPINLRLIMPLYRQVKRSVGTIPADGYNSSDLEELRRVAGKLLRLPVKLAGTTLAGWCIAAITVSVVPHVAPELFPWPHHSSHKISAWLLLVGAPTTTIWVYFAEDRWLKLKITELLPIEALLSVPSSYRFGTLFKLLGVFLLIGILPGVVISHVTLHNIHEIQAGRQSVDSFLNAVPAMIGFLLATFTVVAIGLSIVVAKGLSFPLRHLESAMGAVGSGDLDVLVPVVSNDEIGEVGQGFNRMVQDQKALESIKDTFGRYLSREVVAEILKSPGGTELTGEMREITILVADLRGFTGIAETLEPAKVLQLINRFLQKMTDIIMKHRGTIDEFTGDGILVFFGAPRVLPDHSLRAVVCALEMQSAMRELNIENLRLGFPELQMGIGINSGELIVGNIGSEKRKKYGAVGSAINIAFRIEAETRGAEILVSPSVQDELESLLVSDNSREVSLKGLERSITLFQVSGMIDPLDDSKKATVNGERTNIAI
ncbi:MAG: HAMP domain-containing protein [Desulfomonile tiedjei]|uniref:HAMP domain-containing protein n=1 Tax=Desulfomonile tiedjei TaxID=2358 RepID=A0A9D6V4Q1_9BACT|nr:HAMP domain-containing protein [Desulfomonile tiedjei]